MSERSYTLRDIDMMRKCVDALLSIGDGRPYDEFETHQVIEERLRTYMAGNIDPEELRVKANENRADWAQIIR